MQNSVDRPCSVRWWGLFLSVQQIDCLGKEADFVSAGFGKQCPVSPTRGKEVCDQDVRDLGRAIFAALFLTLDWYRSSMVGRSAAMILSAARIVRCSLARSRLVADQNQTVIEVQMTD